MLRVGYAIKNMDMPIGGDMTGYVARLWPACGVHDPLAIRCVAFDDGKSKFLLVSCDLLALSADSVQSITKQASARTSIEESQFVISCIHTHSGPASIHVQNCGEVNERWLNKALSDIVDCICDSIDNLKPSFLSLKQGSCNAAYNRVTGGKIEDDGQIDSQVTVLEISSRPGGNPHTLLVNYACHPVAAGCNKEYSRDFPYYCSPE